MKNPKGFRGKYFSLAAILALSTTITLANDAKSFSDTQKVAQTQEEFSEDEELTPPSDELNVVVISKKIKTKKSKVYSASKNTVSATNVTDNVSILTSQEMELQGITTITQALNYLPGVSFTSYGGIGQGTQLYLQGMANKYTLVLIDGVRFNDPYNTSGADLSHIMLEDVEKIEVIKGAQSGVWGADAAAGVVNIITKKANPGTHANVGVEIGSYNTKTLSSLLSQKTHTYDVLLSFLRTTTDGFTSIAPKGEDLDQYEDDSYRNTTVNFKAGYWIDSDNRIEVGYNDINSLINFDGSDAFWVPDPDSYKGTDYRSKSGYLKYKYFINRHNIEATLSQSYFHNKQLGLVYSAWSPEVEDSVGTIPSFELKDTFKYGKDNAIVFGASYLKNKIDYTVVNGNEKSKNSSNKAVFANNIYRLNNLIFSQALRYDSFNDFDSKITGKLGLKYLFNDDFNIYANYGTAYKTPKAMDMINIWGTSNFDLEPEKIKSFNAGIEYSGLHVNYFYNEIDDMISWDNATWKNENIDGTSTLKGIELSYEKMFFDTLLLGANYTYTDAKKADGSRIKRLPRYQIGLNASYAVLKNLIISTNGTYIGSRLGLNDITYLDEETGRYFVANVKVDYKINKTWSTYLKVDNILNKEYQTVYGYATAERSFYLGVKANF